MKWNMKTLVVWASWLTLLSAASDFECVESKERLPPASASLTTAVQVFCSSRVLLCWVPAGGMLFAYRLQIKEIRMLWLCAIENFLYYFLKLDSWVTLNLWASMRNSSPYVTRDGTYPFKLSSSDAGFSYFCNVKTPISSPGPLSSPIHPEYHTPTKTPVHM